MKGRFFREFCSVHRKTAIMISKKSIYGNDAILVSLVQLLKTFIKSLSDILLILHDMLDAIEHQLDQLVNNTNMERQQDNVVVVVENDSSSNDEPLAIPVLKTSHMLTKEIKQGTDASNSYDKLNNRFNTLEESVENRIIDLWDDDVEPAINPVAKILNRDLWLPYEVNNIGLILNRLSVVDMTSSDFISFGGPTVITIIMNQFKEYHSIQYKCCQLMADLVVRDYALVILLAEDSRYIRCIVQCMNQFPKDLDIQTTCFRILNGVIGNQTFSSIRMVDMFKVKGMNDSFSGLQVVISCMKEFSTNYNIQSIGCTILYHMASSTSTSCRTTNCKTIMEHGAVGVLSCTLENHSIDMAKKAIQCILEYA